MLCLLHQTIEVLTISERITFYIYLKPNAKHYTKRVWIWKECINLKILLSEGT